MLAEVTEIFGLTCGCCHQDTLIRTIRRRNNDTDLTVDWCFDCDTGKCPTCRAPLPYKDQRSCLQCNGPVKL